jgi:hypothetical protein
MKKVIELAILPEDQNSGVTAIALVDRPAIEVNFLYFKTEEMVKPLATETRDDFMPRCIRAMLDEGKSQDQAVAICISEWQNRGFDKEQEEQEELFVEEDIPYDISSVYTDYEIETMIELAKTLGVPASSVEVNKEKFSKLITETLAEEEVVYLYRYRSSNVASNSRSFCSAMMSIDRYFTREEILILDDLNNEFGPGVGGGRYNVFKYKGGANCQHYWQKYRAVRINGNYLVTPVEPSTRDERLAATAPRTLIGRGFVKNPQRGLPPLAGNVAFKFADEEKRIIVSPIMIPDMEILRLDSEGNEYFVKFSPETILEISKKFMREARTNETNLDHEASVDAGTYLFESWIVETETDKAITKYGFDVPIGTWVGMFQVTDDQVWEMVKSGKLQGVSVEGAFVDAEEIDARKRYEKIRELIQEAKPEDLE